MDNTIGIDISKGRLDVYRLTDGQHRQFPNHRTGHTQLLEWIGMQPEPLVILEATGAYHRQLEQAPGAKTIPFVKVNPKRARRFARAGGKLAKTDREVRVKPHTYQPGKAELEQDVSIKAKPEDVIRATFQQVRIVEDQDA